MRDCSNTPERERPARGVAPVSRAGSKTIVRTCCRMSLPLQATPGFVLQLVDQSRGLGFGQRWVEV
jgi:hypothetical protein